MSPPSRPAFTADDAARLARTHFGLRAEARELPSYLDQNFLLRADDGHRFILKIAHAEEDPAVLDFQQAVLAHLATRPLPLRLPRVCPAPTGERLVPLTGTDGRTHRAWLVTYLSGTFLADLPLRSPALLRSLGHALAHLDNALDGFSHPAMNRPLPWDVCRYADLYGFLGELPDSDQRRLVERWLRRVEVHTAPLLPDLPRSVIHNDANDHNVLATPEAVTGLIDFGDMVHTVTVAEVAIAATYAMLGTTDPIGTAAQVVAGYHAAYPLTGAEVRAFFGLIAMRLCTSVCLSAYRRRQDPHNAYLTVSEQPAWEMLERLAAVSFDEAEATFRRACALS
ncbi:phosphotransferase [Rhodocaloribacter litoris]|uniref:phosphotransferase n=1 Tax=Rhodocaloribacter litoris TaxID=2558931 RepID=UPI00142009FB|nr:phosphotransferase [Rhodocaloribacter litoris]QXD13967.1 phosphotransferase [Rhodocaloribacter litoris]